jgi:hypothetical protein
VQLVSDGSFKYTPNAGFTGTDTFTYQAFDGVLASNEATVTITVNPPASPPLYLSLAKASGTLTGLGPNGSDLAYEGKDILEWNGSNYFFLFDGSAAGLQKDVNVSAFDVDTAKNRILMAFDAKTSVPRVGPVTGSDIVAYDLATGVFSLVFDGSDVGLTTSGEELDALQLLTDGRLIVSTKGLTLVPSGFFFLPYLAFDQDLLAFSPRQLGATTRGTWSFYFDGSDVGLSRSDEGLDAVSVAVTGGVYLSTKGDFSVPGVSGQNEDVFLCTPSSLGRNTACTFSPFFDGTANGLSSDNVDAIDLP